MKRLGSRETFLSSNIYNIRTAGTRTAGEGLREGYELLHPMRLPMRHGS